MTLSSPNPLDEGTRLPAPAAPLGPEQAGWLIERSPDAVLLTDPAGVIAYVNRAFEAMTGFRRDEAIGRTPAILKSGRMSRGFYEHLWATLQAGEQYSGVLVNRRKDGALYHEEKIIRPLLDAQGRITHFLSSGRDVSERVAALERLTRAATHDALTDLPNRTVFLDRLEQALTRARRSGERFAVALLDVDRFKGVNDSLGHAAGDAVLRAVAQRLQHCVRQADTVARLGGDEFALLLQGSEDEAGTARALRGIVEAFVEPIALDDGGLPVSVSVGACLGGVGGADARALLRRADAAMYRAKKRGGCGFEVHAERAAPARVRLGDAADAAPPFWARSRWLVAGAEPGGLDVATPRDIVVPAVSRLDAFGGRGPRR